MSISLGNIASGTRLKAPKVTIYGVGGVGKTSFAAAAPKPIFLFTEEGQGSLDVARFEPTEGDPVIRDWATLIQCLKLLHEGEHDYQTVVIDSLDFAEPLLWRYTAQKHGKDGIEDFGFGKGYIYATDEARVLLQWLDALRNDRKMAIILICHSDTVRFEDPEREAYDNYDLRLHKRFAALVDHWSDAVLFANYRTAVVKDKEGFGNERKRAVGVGERVLHTEKRPAWRAKNRYGLPAEIPLDWKAFQDGIVRPN
jgi:hypothetical protein